MDKLVIDGMNGRTLVIQRVEGRQEPISQGGPSEYRVRLTLPEGSLETDMWDRLAFLASFLREMADAWRGFDGTKEFESTEHELRLECRHDKKGTVECRVTRRRPWAPAWSFEALIDVGAGAHLDRIARDAEGFADRTTT